MRTRISLRAVALGCLMATSTVTACAAAPARTCFRTSEMRNHTVADASTLYVGVGNKDVYRIGMAGNCLAGAQSSDPLVIRTPHSTGMVCRPLDLDVGIGRGGSSGLADGFISHCIVDSITKLAPAEAALLPKKLKP